MAVAWAVSVYNAFQRTWKPFNPILGETYELMKEDGLRFVAEQVSERRPFAERGAVGGMGDLGVGCRSATTPP